MKKRTAFKTSGVVAMGIIIFGLVVKIQSMRVQQQEVEAAPPRTNNEFFIPVPESNDVPASNNEVEVFTEYQLQTIADEDMPATEAPFVGDETQNTNELFRRMRMHQQEQLNDYSSINVLDFCRSVVVQDILDRKLEGSTTDDTSSDNTTEE